MPDRFIVFVERVTDFRIEGGLVYATDYSGKAEFQRVMPVHLFAKVIAKGAKALSEWRVDQSGKVEQIDHWREDEGDQAALP